MPAVCQPRRLNKTADWVGTRQELTTVHLIKKKAGQGTKAAGASAGSAAAVGEAEGAGAAGSAAEGSTKQASGEKQQAAETKYAHAH
eukprot:SAG25_NODE_4448_length_813_cov_1.210084_1_plen_86_part_10